MILDIDFVALVSLSARGTPDISSSLECYLVVFPPLPVVISGTFTHVVLSGVGADSGFLNLQLSLFTLLSTEVLVDPFFSVLMTQSLDFQCKKLNAYNIQKNFQQQ